jgi:hypothetical protein
MFNTATFIRILAIRVRSIVNASNSVELTDGFIDKAIIVEM